MPDPAMSSCKPAVGWGLVAQLIGGGGGALPWGMGALIGGSTEALMWEGWGLVKGTYFVVHSSSLGGWGEETRGVCLDSNRTKPK